MGTANLYLVTGCRGEPRGGEGEADGGSVMRFPAPIAFPKTPKIPKTPSQHTKT